MLWSVLAIKGYKIEASDGEIGTVSDILFDDRSWITRWMVVHTGSWAFGRKILLPRTALGKPDKDSRHFSVQLTRQQVKDSPDVAVDLPVSRQMEMSIYRYYSWPSYWENELSPMGVTSGIPMGMPGPGLGDPVLDGGNGVAADPGDPNLRSVMAVIGYHMEATDGPIGHAEDFWVDPVDGHVRYLTIDTKNWWPGKKVVISPELIKEIDWTTRRITLNADCEKITASPAFDPAENGK
jgi:hypothetical protein